MKSNKITLQHIAEVLGVTPITVSRALNNKPGVSPIIRNRIKAHAEQVGYVPKGENQLKSQAEQKNVLLMVADVFLKTSNNMYIDFYKKILEALQQKNILGILNIVNEHETTNYIIPEIIRKTNIDVIVLLGELPPEYLNILCSLQTPLLLLDFYDERLSLDAVVNNNFFDSYSLTRYLIQKGHRNIAFVGNIYSTHSIQDRFLGYHKALLRANIKLSQENIISDRMHNGEFKKLKLPKIFPTAFVCNCDEIAWHLIRQLKEKGLSAPEDYSVAAFDDTYFGTDCTPPITTIASDLDKMSSVCAEIIVKKIKTPSYKAGLVLVKGKFIERESVKKYLV